MKAHVLVYKTLVLSAWVVVEGDDLTDTKNKAITELNARVDRVRADFNIDDETPGRVVSAVPLANAIPAPARPDMPAVQA